MFHADMGRPSPTKLLATFLVLAASLASAKAEAQVHLSLFHPVSTNTSPDAHANLALSIFQSRIGELHGVGIHPFVSEVSGSASFLQVTGAFVLVRGPMSGIQLTGGVASVHGGVKGLQVAGIGSFVEEGVRGLQVAGIVNAPRGDVRGIQAAGFVNMNGGETRGLQVSSVANISEGAMRGFQVAAGVNLAQESMRGLQIGLGNMAGTIDGTQIGVYNVASHSSGLQLGVINYAGTHEGIPFGLLNLSPESGTVEAVVYGSTLSAANAGVRTTVNGWQSTVAGGYGDLEGDVETAGFVTWAYGYRIGSRNTFSLGFDVGWSHVMPEKSEVPTENDRLHPALTARLLPELRLSDGISLFAGPGATLILDEYSMHAGSRTEVLATAGLAVRP
jgi:hypothetical protein